MTSAETQKYQDALRQLMFEADKTYSWIAAKLHKKEYDIYYAVNRAAKIDVSIYSEIRTVLEAELERKYDCNNLVGLTFQTATVVNREIALVFQTVQNAIADNKLTPLEIETLKSQINSTQKEINNKLNELKRILEGK